MAVIKATNAYLNGIAASDRDKATALAGFINEDPMMVCSLGLEVELTVLPAMPIRGCYSNGTAGNYMTTQLFPTDASTLKITFNIARNSSGGVQWVFGAETSNYGPRFGVWGTGTQLNLRFGGSGTTGGVMTTLSGYTTSSIVTVERRSDKGIYVDGVLQGTPTYTQDVICRTFLYDMNYNETQSDKGPLTGSIMEFEMDEHKYLPFKRNNVMGMLDLTTDTMAPIFGSFSETFLFPDGTSKRINKLIEAHQPANGSASTKKNSVKANAQFSA